MTHIQVIYKNKSHSTESVVVNVTKEMIEISGIHDGQEPVTDDNLSTIDRSTGIEIANEVLFSAPSFDHVPAGYPEAPDTSIHVRVTDSEQAPREFFD